MEQVATLLSKYHELCLFLFAIGYSVGPQFFGSLKKEALPQIGLAAVVALINLYKALGGGWVGEAEKLAPGPAVDTSKNPPIFP